MIDAVVSRNGRHWAKVDGRWRRAKEPSAKARKSVVSAFGDEVEMYDGGLHVSITTDDGLRHHDEWLVAQIDHGDLVGSLRAVCEVRV